MDKTALHLEIKSLDEQGVFEGFASVFNNTDLYDEVVVPGAFTKSIADNPEVPLLWAHDQSQVIGCIRSMVEDATGLKVLGEINLDVEKGKEAYSLLKKKMLKGLSIGYRVIADAMKDGKRLLKTINLMEVSVVACPANPLAQVTVVKGSSNSRSNSNMENEKELIGALGELVKHIDSLTAEQKKQIADSGTVNSNLKADLEKAQEQIVELNAKYAAVESRLVNPATPAEVKSLGARFVESKNFKGMIENGFPNSGKFGVKSILSVDTNGSRIGPAQYVGVGAMAMQRAFVRDFINVSRTGESSIEFAKQLTYTNNAAIQYDSPAYDGAAKNESTSTFVLTTAPVRTIAHYEKASKQVLSDVPQLVDLVDFQLVAGLKAKEEAQILCGTGAAGQLDGIANQATQYNTLLTVAASQGVIGDTAADLLLHAIYQVSLANVVADCIFVHPVTAHALRAAKNTLGNYIFGDPSGVAGMFGNVSTIWGLPVVATLAMTSGKFVVGAFSTAATLYDREDANVAVSNEDQDNFVKNMVTVLAEERVALAVKNPGAFIYGSF